VISDDLTSGHGVGIVFQNYEVKGQEGTFTLRLIHEGFSVVIRKHLMSSLNN